MRKATISALTLIIATFAWGQSDTTKVKLDTIPVTPETPVQVEPGQESEPKIIYYQSDPDKRSRSRSSFRSRSRSGREQIKTLSGSMSHSGGFGALSFKSSSFRDEAMVLTGIRGGWIINRTLALGAEGYGVIPTAKFEDISPSSDNVLLLGGYGGLFMELIFFSNQVVHVTFPVGGGAGWLGYDVSGSDSFSVDFNGMDEDIFWYVEPGANVELNVARNFRLAFGISKRFTQDLELLNTPSNAMEELNYYVTLKVGRF